ncbi:MAG: hypothetical protein U5Q44_02065 [Dehalococcoidia bacterium]|nr:hypothetical protein [Dehalococcoidia bacterium]
MSTSHSSPSRDRRSKVTTFPPVSARRPNGRAAMTRVSLRDQQVPAGEAGRAVR